MSWRLRVELALRGIAVAICVLTSLYAILVFIPFTFIQFIQSHLVGAIDDFVRVHAALVWVAAIAVVAVQWRQIRRGDFAALAVALAMVAAAGVTTWRPLLPRLAGGSESLAVGLLALLPVVLLSVVDARAVWSRLHWPAGENAQHNKDDDGVAGRLFVAAAAAAVSIWALYALMGYMRSGSGTVAGGISRSLTGHLVVFGGLFTMLQLCHGLASSATRPSRREFFIQFLGIAAMIALVLYNVVFAAIAFSGRAAVIVATAMAIALTSTWASTAILIRTAGRAPVTSGLELWLSPSGRRRGPNTTALWLAMLGTAAVVVTTGAGAMDWNFLLQKLVASIVWIAALAVLYSALPPLRLRAAALVMACTLPPVAFGALEARGNPDTAAREADFNPSFRLIRDALARRSSSDAGLYQYLASHTNIPRDQRVEPVSVDLVPDLRASGASLPNIVVVVIDSLRRDYLSPYNPAVTFTPAIDAFARDSLTFQNAFSRYGATGLAEPSIWVGGMIVHKQYVTPFAPMNTLEKLLTAERYRRFVSVDTILRQLLPPDTANLVPLDANVANKDYDLCRSLDELQQRVDPAEAAAPFFAYTQPQNIHVSTIAREGGNLRDGESYPGFHAPTASRIRRMDGCFGAFVERLKQRGLYDNTIIVVTSDHGDSLGEEGRWGHAYTVFPEVLRIPLIVHLPPALAGKFDADPGRLAFSIDITPTLYTLLGHPPTVTARPFGRSLVAARGSSRPEARGDLVVASSYGNVYGLLRDEGRRLYILDGVNFQEHAYDLSRGLNGERTTVDARERHDAQAVIRAQVAEIGRTYRFDPAMAANR